MLRKRLVNVIVVLPILLAANFSLVCAQEGDMFVSVTPTDGQCPADAHAVGYIGYKDLECNCTFTISPSGPRRYNFRAEPVIGGVESGSPADGKLHAGDVIAAIDGYLITTREGGRRFALLTPGDPVTLTVRRRGREVDVELVPGNACYEVTALPAPRVPVPPRQTVEPDVPRSVAPRAVPPRHPTVVDAVPPRMPVPTPTPPRPEDVSSGWVGLSINCVECGFTQSEGRMVWEFSSPPEVERVESHSPADRAGIQAGDRLTHINGHSITSAEGGKLFSGIEPGDTVTYRYARNASTREAQIVAETRVRYRARTERGWTYYRRDDVPQPAEPITRFSGVVGDTHVLVTGGLVSVNRTEDEVVIQAGDVTVRVRRTGGNEDGSRR